MKQMRARCVPKWQLSVATGFAHLREHHSDIDTIPKPAGLDSRCTREARGVGLVFIEYSMNFQWLFDSSSMLAQMRYGR
jgi:hypothetical protein